MNIVSTIIALLVIGFLAKFAAKTLSDTAQIFTDNSWIPKLS